MRELKFRAWDKAQKKYIIPQRLALDDDGALDFYVYNRGGYALECFIIEQYTGLKDKNGREIYEGDIVRWSFKVDRNSELTYTADAVKWESYAEEEWPYSTVSGFTLPESEDGHEVIGNIHENPELLGEEEWS
jgi:uncharacterized phage protein (TIGR01671 family)